MSLQEKNSNTTLVKVKYCSIVSQQTKMVNSNTTLVKVKFPPLNKQSSFKSIQIQLLLKLNWIKYRQCFQLYHSNTTLVKVK